MATLKEMKEATARLKEESRQRVAAMSDQEKKQLEQTSRQFSKKCEIPQDAQISSK